MRFFFRLFTWLNPKGSSAYLYPLMSTSFTSPYMDLNRPFRSGMIDFGLHCVIEVFKGQLDSSLVMLTIQLDVLWVLVYVDDIVITSSNHALIHKFMKKLNVEFSLRDLGNLFFFPSIEMFHDATGLYLCQTKYIIKLLDRVDMLKCHTSPTPATTST